MKRLLNILTILAFPLSGFATAQYGDILIYKGDTLILFSNPLEQYFESKGKRAINHYELSWTSTACYRGYRATWEIVNDSLYLIRVQKACYSKEPQYFNLTKEFGADKAFANWFSGKALAPKGKLIHYVHSGYDSFYETEIMLTFKDGILTGQVEYDNSKSYKSVFAENRDSLQNFIYRNINWSIIPDLNDESIKVLISIQSGESVKADSITIFRGSDSKVLNEEAVRVIKMLPEWNVYYRKGEVYRMKWIVPLIFNEEKRKKYAR